MSGGAGKTLAGGQRSIQRGQAAAGVQQVGLLCDFPEQRVSLLAAGQNNDRTSEDGQLETHDAAQTCYLTTVPFDWNIQVEKNNKYTQSERLPVLAVLSHGPLVPAGHFTFVASFARRTHFNGGVLERRSRHGHLVSTLHR